MYETVPYLVIVGLSFVGILGDFFLKLASQAQNRGSLWFFLIFGLVTYGLTAFGWFYVIKFLKLSTIGIWYALTTIIFLTLIGVLRFDEHLTLREVIGIVTAICSLVLLARFA